MHCALYTAGTCRSCQWLEKPYPQQLADKQHHLHSLLAGRDVALLSADLELRRVHEGRAHTPYLQDLRSELHREPRSD